MLPPIGNSTSRPEDSKSQTQAQSPPHTLAHPIHPHMSPLPQLRWGVAQRAHQGASHPPATTDPEPAEQLILLAPPATGSNQATGVWEDSSPRPSGSSIFSNSEQLKMRGRQPCRTGGAALWAAYIPRSPDTTQCYHQDLLCVCVCVCARVYVISSNV